MKEKTADIDILEELIRDYKDEKEFVGEEIIKAMETLIAENKELKEENEGLKTKLDTLIEKYKELKEEIENWKFTKEYVEKNYIDKSKIKAKIEEVEQWGLYNMKIPKLSTLDERLGAKIGIKYVLQSLLGEE